MRAYESIQAVPASEGRGRVPFLLALCFAVLGVIVYFVWQDKIAMVILGMIALAAGYLMFRSPELSTLFFVLILYTNLAVVAITVYRVPPAAAAAVSLLPMLPFAHYLIHQRARVIVDYPFGLMLAYFGALLGTSILAKDMMIALGEVVNFF